MSKSPTDVEEGEILEEDEEGELQQTVESHKTEDASLESLPGHPISSQGFWMQLKKNQYGPENKQLVQIGSHLQPFVVQQQTFFNSSAANNSRFLGLPASAHPLDPFGGYDPRLHEADMWEPSSSKRSMYDKVLKHYRNSQILMSDMLIKNHNENLADCMRPKMSIPTVNVNDDIEYDENFDNNSKEKEDLSELQLRLEALKTTIKKINKSWNGPDSVEYYSSNDENKICHRRHSHVAPKNSQIYGHSRKKTNHNHKINCSKRKCNRKNVENENFNNRAHVVTSAAEWQREQRAKILNLTDPKQQYEEYLNMIVTPRYELVQNCRRRRRPLLPLPNLHPVPANQPETSYSSYSYTQDDYTTRNMELDSGDENDQTNSSIIELKSVFSNHQKLPETKENDQLTVSRPQSQNSVYSIQTISIRSSNRGAHSPTPILDTNENMGDSVQSINPDCKDEDEVFILRCPTSTSEKIYNQNVNKHHTYFHNDKNYAHIDNYETLSRDNPDSGLDLKSDDVESTSSIVITEKFDQLELREEKQDKILTKNDNEESEDDEEMFALREILLKSMQKKKQRRLSSNNKAVEENSSNNDFRPTSNDSKSFKEAKKMEKTPQKLPLRDDFLITLNTENRRNVEFRPDKNSNMTEIRAENTKTDAVASNFGQKSYMSSGSPSPFEKRPPSSSAFGPTTSTPATGQSSSSAKFPSLRCTIVNNNHCRRQNKVSPFSVDRRNQKIMKNAHSNLHKTLSVNHEPVIICMDSENSDDEIDQQQNMENLETADARIAMIADNDNLIPPPLINLEQCLKEARKKSEMHPAPAPMGAPSSSSASTSTSAASVPKSNLSQMKNKYKTMMTMKLLRNRLSHCRQDLIQHKKLVSEDKTRLRTLESTSVKRKTDLKLAIMKMQKIKEELKLVTDECAVHRAFILRLNKEIQSVQSRVDKASEMQLIYEKQWSEIQTLLAKHKNIVNKNKKKRKNSLNRYTKRCSLSSNPSSSILSYPDVFISDSLTTNADFESNFCENKSSPSPTEVNFEPASSSKSIITDNSPLFCFKNYRLNRIFLENYPHLLSSLFYCNKIDPNIPFCPFALSGACRDADCRWQHECDFKLSEVEAIADLLAYCPSLVNNRIDGDSIVKCAEKVYVNLKDQMTLQQILEDCCHEIAGRREEDPSLVLDVRNWRPSQIIGRNSNGSGKIDFGFYCQMKGDGPVCSGEENNAEFLDSPIPRSIAELSDSLRYYASNYFESELKQEPNNVKLWIAYASSIYNESTQDNEIGLLKALKILCDGLEKNRSSVDLWLTYLNFYVRQSKPPLAVRHVIERALTFAPCFELRWLYWNNWPTINSDNFGSSDSNLGLDENLSCFNHCLSFLRQSDKTGLKNVGQISFRFFCIVTKLLMLYLAMDKIDEAKDTLKKLLTNKNRVLDVPMMLSFNHYTLLWCALIYMEHMGRLPAIVSTILKNALSNNYEGSKFKLSKIVGGEFFNEKSSKICEFYPKIL